MNNQIQNKSVSGSLSQQAAQNGQSLAETFVNADVVVIVDTSGSMSMSDGFENSRYERACDELAKIQKNMPGKICVLSFSDQVMFCPSGVPWNYEGGTNLAAALKFAKVADVPDMRFIVISDGEPTEGFGNMSAEDYCIQIARGYKNHIDTIYIGRENGSGQEFLTRLAKASGGISARDFSAAQLETTVKGLLQA